MGVFPVLFLLSATLVGLPVFAAAAAPCFSPALTEGVEIWDGKRLDILPVERICDSQTLAYKVMAALDHLKSLPELAPAGVDFRRDFMTETPYSFFKRRVKNIRVDMDPASRICGVAGYVAYVSGAKTQTINICPLAGHLTRLALQSNLLHEAHHLSGSDATAGPRAIAAHPHVLCLQGQAKGYDACDASYDGGGAYALQTEFLLKVARTPSLPAEDRQEARGLALSSLLDHFNQLPFPMPEGILLRAQTGAVEFFDGRRLWSLIDELALSSLVALRGVPVILNPNTGDVKSYAGGSALVETPGSFAKFYRAQTAQERAKVLDVYFGGWQACLLYASSVYCEVGESKVEVAFPPGFRPLFLNTISLYGDDMVFVVNSDGDMHLLPFKLPVDQWSFERLEKNKTLTHFRSVGMLSNLSNFGLEMDGSLVSFTSVRDRVPVVGFENRRFHKILGSFRWSPRLLDL